MKKETIKLLKITSASVLVVGFSLLSFVKLNLDKTTSYTPRSYRQHISKKGGLWAGAAEYYRAIRANANGVVDPADIEKAKTQVMALAKNRASSTLTFEEIGPDNIGGRTRAILVDKTVTDGSKVFAGSVTGGLYVSFNGGGFWQPVNDHLENLAVSCITQAANGDIYFGTGCDFESSVGGNFGSGSGFGKGIYKSTDGGQTFTALAATVPKSPITSNSDWSRINSIAADPNNSNRIYAATNKGIRITDNGGQTWYNPIWTGCTTANDTIGVPTTNLKGMSVKVASNGNVFVALNGALYKSVDGSICSFERISGSTGNPIPNTVTRMEIAVSPQDPNYVYVIKISTTNYLAGVYQSQDGGITWKTILLPIPNYFDPFSVGSGVLSQGQGDYDCALAVDPANKGKIFMGGVQLWAWDGSLKRIAGEFVQQFSGYYVHSDKHTFAFDPNNPNNMYVGSDGGVSRSYDAGKQFFPANRGYNVTQFYSVAYDNNGTVMGGTQDNGTLQIDGMHKNSPKEGVEVSGGDGFDCDYSNITDAAFVSVYYGDIRRMKGSGAAGIFCNSGDDCTSSSLSDTCCIPGQAGPFYSVLRLWETRNDPNSQDTITFKAEDGSEKRIMATGNGSKTYSGKIITPQSAAKLVPGSITIQVLTQTLTDDGNGNFTGSGSGTINYTTKEYSITFNNTLSTSSLIEVLYSATYNAGDTLTLFSNTGDNEVPVTHILASSLNAGDVLKVQDPIQSMLAVGVGGGYGPLLVARKPLNFSSKPAWIKIPGVSGVITCLEWAKSGAHLYVGTTTQGVWRVSGLNKVYDKASVSNATVTKVFQTTRYVTGLAVDQNDANNVIATLGGYGFNDNIYFSTSAALTTSSNTFKSIHSNLPNLPVYDAIIHKLDPNIAVIGTDFGVFMTDNLLAAVPTWTDQNATFSHTPVFAVREQALDWQHASNEGVIYIGSHGRGIWKTATIAGIAENKQNTAKSNEFISELTVFPNPSQDRRTITFKSDRTDNGTIVLYDLSGRSIFSSKQQFVKGENKITLQNDNLPVGSYFVVVQTSSFKVSTKMVVIR